MIREAGPEDARSISEIRINGWKSAYQGIVDDEYFKNISYEEEYDKFYKRLSKKDKDSNENIIVYADENNNILGFSIFLNLLDNKYDCELQAIYVEPSNKGKGIGTAMLNYVQQYFKERGKKNMILFCLKENKASRIFYEKRHGILCEECDKKIAGMNLRVVGYKFEL